MKGNSSHYLMSSLTCLNTRLVKFAFRSNRDSGKWLLADVHLDYNSLPRESVLSPSSDNLPWQQIFFKMVITNSQPGEWRKSVIIHSPTTLAELLVGEGGLVSRAVKDLVLRGRLNEKDIRKLDSIFRHGLLYDGLSILFDSGDYATEPIILGRLGDEDQLRMRNMSPTNSRKGLNMKRGLSPKLRGKLQNARQKFRMISTFKEEKPRKFDEATPEERLLMIQQKLTKNRALARAKRMHQQWDQLQDKKAETAPKSRVITLEELQYLESKKNLTSKKKVVEFDPLYTEKYVRHLDMKICGIHVSLKFQIFTYCLKKYILVLAYR